MLYTKSLTEKTLKGREKQANPEGSSGPKTGPDFIGKKLSNQDPILMIIQKELDIILYSVTAGSGRVHVGKTELGTMIILLQSRSREARVGSTQA